MKMSVRNFVLTAVCTALISSLSFAQTIIEPCGTDQAVRDLMATDPTYAAERAVMESSKGLSAVMRRSGTGSPVVTIPVAVHYVRHSSMPTLTAFRPSIQAMLNQLNYDFNNVDTASFIRTTFLADAACVNFEFCWDTTFTRTSSYSCYSSGATGMKYTSSGGSDTYSPLNYLNIWIVDLCGTSTSGVAGYAYLPTPGMHGSAIDGLVLDYQLAFYSGSHVATHEIGHHFDLCHTWGCSGGGCSDDDGFTDTPNSNSNNFGCSSSATSCGSPDQIENFMDYSSCPVMFTEDQAAHMLSILNTTRSTYKTPTGCAITGLVADFSTPDTVICEGETATFSDLSTGSPTSYTWSFPGGTPSSSTSANPTVTYNTAGTYNVTLTVSDGSSSDGETKTGYITVIGTNALPLMEGFEGGSVTPPDWSIGNPDGGLTWDVTTSASGYGTSTYSIFVDNYNYNAAGQQDVLFTPFYDFSSSTSAELSFDYAYARYDATHSDTLGIWYTTDCGDNYTLLWFDGGTTLATAPDNTSIFVPTASEWATERITLPGAVLGSSSVQFAFVNYTGYGNTLLLDNINITDSAGVTPTPPVADFIGVPTAIPVGSTVDYTDLSLNTPTSWDWSFPGAVTATSSVMNPTGIQYNTVGTYDVTLIVTNADGADTLTKTNYITVYDTTSTTNCDTLMNLFVPFVFINPGDSADFEATIRDNDGNTPSAGLPATFTSNWMIFFEEVAPGDTNYMFGATSWFTTADTADNWITLGPITLPTGGGNLYWRHLYANNNFRDGYRVLVDTIGDEIADFASSPVAFSVTDNDPSTDGDTMWASHTYPLDPAVYGGKEIYVAIHHNAFDQLLLFIDDVIVEGCSNPGPIAGFTATPTEVCAGETVTFTDTSQFSPTSWNWSFPGGTPSVSTAANPTVTYNTAGMHDVTLIVSNTDGSDTLTMTNYITVNANPSINLVSLSNVNCYGGSDGSITVSATGGMPGYSYSWSPSGSGASISSLTAGTYTVTVTDANMCSASMSYAVTQPFSPLDATTTAVNANCGGSDGSTTVSATGGTSPYTYSWSSGGSAATETGLSAGSYTVTVTDSLGCMTTAMATVGDNPSTISITMNQSPELCGGMNGSASAIVSGGTMPYDYAWSSGGTTANITGLSAGPYSITVTDDNGCTAASAVTVQDTSYTITITFTKTDANCGASDGSATAMPSGGATPYDYSWSSGGTMATETGLSAASYTVTVTDANGCTGTGNVSISNIGAPTVTTSSTMPTCFGGSDGTATVTASGGTPGYGYSWSSGGSMATETGLSSGPYTVTVTDMAGCIAIGNVDVVDPPQLTVTVTGVNEGCNQGNGSATANASGGTGAGTYTYEWSNSETTSTITGLSANVYLVTVTDANGCTASGSVGITNIPGPSNSVISVVNATCSGLEDGEADLTVVGGATPFTFAWSNGATTEDLIGVGAGDYSVTITDANNCTITNSATIGNDVDIELSVAVTHTSGGGSDGSATATASGGSTPYSYSWSSGGSGPSVSGLAPGTYSVTATDGNGCFAIDTFYVGVVGAISGAGQLFDEVSMYPNPVSDVLVVDVELASVSDVSVNIVNALGEVIWTDAWQSFIEGQERIDVSQLPAGIYIIRLQAENAEYSTRFVKSE